MEASTTGAERYLQARLGDPAYRTHYETASEQVQPHRNKISPFALTRTSTPTPPSDALALFELGQVWQSKSPDGKSLYVAGIDGEMLWLRGEDGQYRHEDPTYIAQYYQKVN